jgi:hypothetical protein
VVLNGNINAPSATGLIQTPGWKDYWEVNGGGMDLFRGDFRFKYTFYEDGDFRYYWCQSQNPYEDYIKYVWINYPEYNVLYKPYVTYPYESIIVYCDKYNAISGEREFYNFIFFDTLQDNFYFLDGENNFHSGLPPYPTITVTKNIPNQILGLDEDLIETKQSIYFKQIDNNKFKMVVSGEGGIGLPVAISGSLPYNKETIIYTPTIYNFGGYWFHRYFKTSHTITPAFHNLYNIIPQEFKYKGLLSYINQHGSVENINYEL